MLKFHLSFVAATTRMKDNGGGGVEREGARKEEGQRGG